MSLRQLLDQATPGEWKYEGGELYADQGRGEGPLLSATEADARLVALAPEMAELLDDAMAWMAEKYPEAAADPDRVCSPPAELLARFAELERKAAT